jgi:hypothetical protein
MSIHFLHVRKQDAQGNLSTKGGTTFAFDVEDSADGVSVNVVYSEARCHGDKQNFSRRIGRAVAEGRFNKGTVAGVLKIEQGDNLFGRIRAALANLV